MHWTQTSSGESGAQASKHGPPGCGPPPGGSAPPPPASCPLQRKLSSSFPPPSPGSPVPSPPSPGSPGPSPHHRVHLCIAAITGFTCAIAAIISSPRRRRHHKLTTAVAAIGPPVPSPPSSGPPVPSPGSPMPSPPSPGSPVPSPVQSPHRIRTHHFCQTFFLAILAIPIGDFAGAVPAYSVCEEGHEEREEHGRKPSGIP